MKTISCGILVKLGADSYVLGHATGQEHYDMFKGRMEEGETYVQTAIRECREESGLEFKEDDLEFIGKFFYTKKKDLVVFMTKVDSIDMESLKCTTYLDESRLEMDHYKLVGFDEMIPMLGKSMGILFKKLEPFIRKF